jgi:hypothetical protein
LLFKAIKILYKIGDCAVGEFDSFTISVILIFEHNLL